jgi:hypothetical protein
MISAPPFSALSRLIGAPVSDNHGVNVGHVTDILVDRSDGRIAYIQLRLDFGRVDRACNIKLPWSSFHPAAGEPPVLQLRVGRPTLRALLAGD